MSLTRKAPLRRSSRLSRQTALARYNRKRRASEFARCYHSKERVAWVKSLPCYICGATPSDNAHSEGGGAGRKAGYETIGPLCREHHEAYDQHKYPFDIPEARRGFKRAASLVAALWEAQTA